MAMSLVPLVVFSVPVTAALAAAQTEVLNPPFTRTSVVGDVLDFRMHPSVGEVVFRADVRNDDSLELYRVPLDASRAPRPVVALAAGRSVWQYEFTDDGRWLVWRGEGECDGEVGLFIHRVGVPLSTRISPRAQGEVLWFEVRGGRLVYATGTQPAPAPTAALWSVPIDGSAAPVCLTPTGGQVVEVAFASLAPRLAFIWRDGANVLGLYSVLLDGSAAPLLLDLPGSSPSSSSHQALEITADDERAVYSAFVAGDHRVRSVPLDGSLTPVELAGANGLVARSLVSPDGARLVYWANELDPQQFEIFSRPIEGGVAQRISDPLSGEQYVELVAVHEERAYFLRTGGAIVPRLVSAPIQGGGPARELATYGDDFFSIRFTADGQRAVFQTGQKGYGFFREELYSVPLDASAPAVLLSDSAYDFALSPTSTHVLFSRSLPHGGVWVAPLDGSSPAVEVASGGQYPNQIRLGFTPDGAGVLAVIDGEEDALGEWHLYRASASGVGHARLSGELAPGFFTDVDGFTSDLSGARVVFTADTEVDGRRDLFAVPSDGSEEAEVILDGFSLGLSRLTPDGLRVVYYRGGGLWSAPIDASAAPLAINAPITPGKQLASFLLTPDGARVLYHVAGGSSLTWELWSTTVTDGTAVLLDTAQHSDALVSADSQFAFYRVWDPVALTYRLRRAALDGSGWVELAAASVRAFVVSPDDEWVLYTALPHGLFAAPADGSAPAFALEPGLLIPDALGRDGFRVTPDGTEALYIAGPADGSTRALHAAPLDRSAPPRQLSEPVAPSSDGVTSFLLVPDGARALYVAQDDALPAQGLFSVPLDGSTPPVSLNASFANGQWFAGPASAPFLAATPDGAAIVYVAAAAFDGVQDLFVVPPDGSVAPRRLNRVLTNGGDVDTGSGVRPFVLTPDSTRVVYCADGEVDGVFELWLVPLDGSTAAVRLNPPLVAPGALADFALTGDGVRLLYRATRTRNVSELFSTKLPAMPQQRHAARR